MVCGRLYCDGITQVDQFDPAECTVLVEIDDDVVGFNVCSPASGKSWWAENSWRASVS